MGECLFNSSVTDTPAPGPDELLSLFALLILLSTGAIQIRAHGPLGSQEGGQPQLVAPRCASLCAVRLTLQVILEKAIGWTRVSTAACLMSYVLFKSTKCPNNYITLKKYYLRHWRGYIFSELAMFQMVE